MNQLAHIAPASDYDTIRAAIRYLSENGPDGTDLGKFARALGLTERQLTDLFRRWCGLSPKSFAQAVALDHAKSLLRDKASVLDTTYFFVRTIVSANGISNSSFQSGHVPVAGTRHADSIIS